MLSRIAGFLVLILALSLLAISLSSCSLLPADINRKAVSVAEQSCQRLSLSERVLLRDSINAQFVASAAAKPPNADGSKAEPIVWCGVRCPGNPPPNVSGCSDPAP
jgi:hypothetical protein